MWGSDYPHPDSTWPFSRQIIDKDSAHLSPEMKKKVIHDNAAALYGLGKENDDARRIYEQRL
jgi:predicted TIM-barrel fold metal-dependent hydrolase